MRSGDQLPHHISTGQKRVTYFNLRKDAKEGGVVQKESSGEANKKLVSKGYHSKKGYHAFRVAST